MDLSQGEKKDRFLEAYAKCGIITVAAEAAGVNRQCHYAWLKEDPNYPARFADAKEAAADRIDAEIVRRGVTGVDEPVFGTIYSEEGKPLKKDVVGHIRRYSDVLLIFRAKLLRPEYRERYELEVKDTSDGKQRADFVSRRLADIDRLLSRSGGVQGPADAHSGNGNGRSVGGNGKPGPHEPA